jgi:DNA-binding MarR family transcriptional regulator
MTEFSALDEELRSNLIRFAAFLFSKMATKYGGSTTLNELLMLNYGFVCHARGKELHVTNASKDPCMPKSTVSRLLTEMRAKGFVKERQHPVDRQKRIFHLADEYLDCGNTDIQNLLDWCARPENRLALNLSAHGSEYSDTTG